MDPETCSGKTLRVALEKSSAIDSAHLYEGGLG